MDTAKTKQTKIKPVSLKTKTDVQGTMLSLQVGIPTVIKSTEIKACSLRSAKRKLEKKGYYFDLSERDRVDDVIVTRLK